MENVSREAIPIICNFVLFKGIMKKCGHCEILSLLPAVEKLFV